MADNNMFNYNSITELLGKHFQHFIQNPPSEEKNQDISVENLDTFVEVMDTWGSEKIAKGEPPSKEEYSYQDLKTALVRYAKFSGTDMMVRFIMKYFVLGKCYSLTSAAKPGQPSQDYKQAVMLFKIPGDNDSTSFATISWNTPGTNPIRLTRTDKGLGYVNFPLVGQRSGQMDQATTRFATFVAAVIYWTRYQWFEKVHKKEILKGFKNPPLFSLYPQWTHMPYAASLNQDYDEAISGNLIVKSDGTVVSSFFNAKGGYIKDGFTSFENGSLGSARMTVEPVKYISQGNASLKFLVPQLMVLKPAPKRKTGFEDMMDEQSEHQQSDVSADRKSFFSFGNSDNSGQKRQKNNVGQPVPAFESFTGASIAANTKPVATPAATAVVTPVVTDNNSLSVAYDEQTVHSTAIETAAQ